jgi:hypothetical protein
MALFHSQAEIYKRRLLRSGREQARPLRAGSFNSREDTGLGIRTSVLQRAYLLDVKVITIVVTAQVPSVELQMQWEMIFCDDGSI